MILLTFNEFKLLLLLMVLLLLGDGVVFEVIDGDCCDCVVDDDTFFMFKLSNITERVPRVSSLNRSTRMAYVLLLYLFIKRLFKISNLFFKIQKKLTFDSILQLHQQLIVVDLLRLNYYL